MNPALAKFILARPFGFITDDDRRELLELDRLCPLVVRCECCRFICAVQDLPVLLGYVRAGGGHLRDVSIHPDTIKAARAPMQATINAMKPAPPPRLEKWADCAACGDRIVPKENYPFSLAGQPHTQLVLCGACLDWAQADLANLTADLENTSELSPADWYVVKGWIHDAKADLKAQAADRPQAPPFNESDCGGAFDGTQVTSDADPGL